MYSQQIFASNKNALVEIFEAISQFPELIMIKSGAYTVDAHSLIGVFSLDITKPMELITERRPDDSFMASISKFIPARAVS